MLSAPGGHDAEPQLQQFIRKNHDLIVKWYQHDHLSWTVIAARLNQCRRGGGITAEMVQAALPYLQRSPRSGALVVVAEDSTSAQRAALAALEEQLRKQEAQLRLQNSRVKETTARWARLEELTNQLLPLVYEARSAAGRLPRTSPAARQVRESLEQLVAVLEAGHPSADTLDLGAISAVLRQSLSDNA